MNMRYDYHEITLKINKEIKVKRSDCENIK